MKNSDLKLVIGDKNLSSWSMRAWLALKQSDLPFEEILVLLDQPDTHQKIKFLSPSNKVPCLIHGDLKIWDSLAIGEYIAELAPQSGLWPAQPSARAMARSYAAEMHSGFSSLRSQLSMDIRLKMQVRHLTASTVSDIQRIVSLWEQALEQSKGPFLFGRFGIVDAFYAPVVFRFLSYGVQITSPAALQYMKAIEDFPIVRSWADGALLEKPVEQKF